MLLWCFFMIRLVCSVILQVLNLKNTIMKHRKIYLTGLLSIASLIASAQNQVEQLPIYIDKLKPTEIPETAEPIPMAPGPIVK